MADDTLHVALATNTAYLPWCATAVLSCVTATRGHALHVHVLHEGDVTRGAQQRFTAMVHDAGSEVSFHGVRGEQLAMVPSKGPALGGRTSWIRILLPAMLPEVDRLVYLDADTLTVDSLVPLWGVPLEGIGLAAVANVVEPAQRPHVAQLGITDARQYFNAGVLVMNLAFMRADDTFGKVVECVAARGADFTWFDQDALNVVFADRWRALDPRWNAQNSLWFWEPWATEVFGADAVHAARTAPAIVHFEGPSIVKPWHYLCPHLFRELYLDTLARTPWRAEPLVERTPATRVIRRLPKALQLPAYTRLQAARHRRARV